MFEDFTALYTYLYCEGTLLNYVPAAQIRRLVSYGFKIPYPRIS